MNCKNCKYFYWETIILLPPPNRREGKCSNKLLSEDSTLDCPENGVLATCDEGRGELIVGPNFGCIHFEQKINE